MIEDVAAQQVAPTCNICGGREFADIRRRKAVRCVGCGTLERGRVMYLALTELGLVRPGMRVLHIAPEPGIARFIKKVVGAGYTGADINAERFDKDLEVRRFDLVTDIESLPDGEFDLIIHSHVMEHIPCDVTAVLVQLHRALKPTGRHVFCVPISKGCSASDLNPLTAEQRTARFGQFDHVRRFGREDFQRHFGMVFDLAPFDPLARHSPEELLGMNVPVPPGGAPTSNTIFVQDKASLKLRA